MLHIATIALTGAALTLGFIFIPPLFARGNDENFTITLGTAVSEDEIELLLALREFLNSGEVSIGYG